jgi:hypothetical protein
MSKKRSFPKREEAITIRLTGNLIFGQNQRLPVGTRLMALKQRNGDWLITSGPAKGQCISPKLAQSVNPPATAQLHAVDRA